MTKKKQILAIIGSTRANSSNLKVVQYFAALTKVFYDVTIFERICELPHFNPDLDDENLPSSVVEFL